MLKKIDEFVTSALPLNEYKLIYNTAFEKKCIFIFMFVAICCFIFSFKFYFILILQTEYDSQNRRICMWMKSTFHRCSTLINTTGCQKSLRRCRCRCLHLNNIKNNTSNHVNTQIAWRK